MYKHLPTIIVPLPRRLTDDTLVVECATLGKFKIMQELRFYSAPEPMELHDRLERLHLSAQGNSRGGARGYAVKMTSWGIRCCANWETSAGSATPYSSMKHLNNTVEVATIATSVWPIVKELMPHVDKEFNLPNQVPSICIGKNVPVFR